MLEGLGWFNSLRNILEIQAFFDSIFLGPTESLDIQWGLLAFTHFYPFHLKGHLGNFCYAPCPPACKLYGLEG